MDALRIYQAEASLYSEDDLLEVTDSELLTPALEALREYGGLWTNHDNSYIAYLTGRANLVKLPMAIKSKFPHAEEMAWTKDFNQMHAHLQAQFTNMGNHRDGRTEDI